MKKLLAIVITVLIGIAFVTTGFAQDKAAPPPQDKSVTAPAPEKEKPAKKEMKKKKKTKKAKKAKAAKPAEKAEPATPATPPPAK
jgi:hypothetical protein